MRSTLDCVERVPRLNTLGRFPESRKRGFSRIGRQLGNASVQDRYWIEISKPRLTEQVCHARPGHEIRINEDRALDGEVLLLLQEDHVLVSDCFQAVGRLNNLG